MPYRVRFHDEADLVEVQAYGKFTGPEFLDLSDEIRSHARNRDGLIHLYDFSEADVRTITGQALKPVSQRRPLHDVAHYVIVAPDDLAFGLSRMFELSSIDREDRVHVFRERAAALAWIESRRTG